MGQTVEVTICRRGAYTLREFTYSRLSPNLKSETGKATVEHNKHVCLLGRKRREEDVRRGVVVTVRKLKQTNSLVDSAYVS